MIFLWKLEHLEIYTTRDIWKLFQIIILLRVRKICRGFSNINKD